MRDLRRGPVRSLRLQRHRQLQHRRRGLRGDPPRRGHQCGEPAAAVVPDPPVQACPGDQHRHPERPRVSGGGNRPDQPAPLLGAQRGVEGVLDQAVPEQPHLLRPGPAGLVLVLLLLFVLLVLVPAVRRHAKQRRQLGTRQRHLARVNVALGCRGTALLHSRHPRGESARATSAARAGTAARGTAKGSKQCSQRHAASRGFGG